MKIVEDKNGKYLRITPDGFDLPVKMLLGANKPANSDVWRVENNIVNRIALGLPLEELRLRDLKYGDGLEQYQRTDVMRMVAMPNILNANPMGLGKTVETICAMRELHVINALIVVPKSVMLQWKLQFGVWWKDKFADVDILPKVFKQNHIVICNYEMLTNKHMQEELHKFVWDVIVLDEAHRIKSRKAVRTEAVKQVKADRHWALTGTPVLNKPDDLWSILEFLDKRFSGISYWTFVNYFCHVEEGFWGRNIIGLSRKPERVEMLTKLMEHVSIRNNITVSKGKQISKVVVEMSPKQRKLYKSVQKILLDELPDTLTIPNGAVLCLRLLQISSYAGIFEPDCAGGKFEWLLDFLNDHEDEKVVVFSRFSKVVYGLDEYLSKHKIKTVTYTGDKSTAERHLVLQDFIKGDAKVLAGTIGSLGQSVDGLQEASRVVVFIDRDWSPEIMVQAEDRLSRMGQVAKVLVYYLECEKSIDQHVGKVNFNKASDVRRILNE